MNEKISRREFLERGTKAVLAVAGLTACGRLLSADALAMGEAKGITVGKDRQLLSVAELKEKGVVNFVHNGKKSILLYNGGEIRAFENICTHQGGPNRAQGPKLVCQWHGATFDPLTGAATKGPAPTGSRLAAIKLDVKDGKIFIAVAT